MDIVLQILPWALPPLIGAAIGYITNAIAIAMLFRPYTAKKLLGVKIPMTPGIIPKERYELSGNIGNMVSRELLTEDAVRNQISSPLFKKGVQDSIKRLTEKVLNTPLKDLKNTFSGGFLSSSKDGETLQFLVTDILNKFLSSEGLTVMTRGLLSKGIGYLEEKTLSDLLSSKVHILDRILKVLLSRKSREHLEAWIVKSIERWIHDNRKISEVLSPARAEAAGKAALRIYELLFPEFIKFLDERSTRAELEIRGRFLLKDILDKLNGVQRFILSAAQYDRTLEENIGSIVDDLVRNLKEAGMDPDIKERIYEAVVSSLKRFSGLSLGEVVAAWDGDFRGDLDKVMDTLFSVLFSDGFREKFILRIKDFISGNGDLKIREVLYGKLGLSVEFVREELPVLLIPDVLFLKKLFSVSEKGTPFASDRSIAEIFSIDPQLQSSIIEPAAQVFLDLLSQKIPDILKSVDVQSLVVKKIDSLEIEKIEELILVVVKKQLRWINVFGALLGSIIGTVQILLNLSMR